MKRSIIFFTLLLATASSFAQNLDENTFDFWVGNWQLTWVDANGGKGRGTNEITRLLDDKVIQEHFEAKEGQLLGFKGTSISVFNPQNQSWHQTWQDNQGGNLIFLGRTDGQKKFFETVPIDNNQSRMVFYDFSPEGFTWDWEATTDGGQTWTLNWRIQYKRMH